MKFDIFTLFGYIRRGKERTTVTIFGILTVSIPDLFAKVYPKELSEFVRGTNEDRCRLSDEENGP